ncbi:MAG: hypothetical protein R3B72_28355 [Polyangiaceae bacterium]
MAALLGTPHARAEPPGRVRLSWARGSGADGCPDQASIEAGVRARLGYDPFTLDGATSIEAVVTRDDGGHHLEVHVRRSDGSAAGRRQLADEAQACAGIAEAAVLAIALAIDPEQALRPPPPPAPPPAPAPPPEPLPGPSPAPSTSVPPPLRAPGLPPAPPDGEARAWFRGGGEVGAVVVAGVLPRAAAGLTAEAFGQPLPWLRVGLGARVLPAVDNASGELEVSLAGGFLRICGTPFAESRWQLLGCFVSHVGALGLGVKRLTPLDSGQRLWLSEAASLDGRVRAYGPLTFGLGADLEIPLLRDDLRVEGRGDRLHRAGAVAGGAHLTAGLDIF